MNTIAEFIASHGITMTATLVSKAEATKGLNSDHANQDHWNVLFSCGKQRYQTSFYMGMGLRATRRGFENLGQPRVISTPKPPKAEDVLDCIASDAAGFINARGFEDWASEYGYDTDSRKAEATYRAVEAETIALRKLLGSEAAFQSLLFDTERL